DGVVIAHGAHGEAADLDADGDADHAALPALVDRGLDLHAPRTARRLLRTRLLSRDLDLRDLPGAALPHQAVDHVLPLAAGGGEEARQLGGIVLHGAVPE